jgi:hypothetical protein
MTDRPTISDCCETILANEDAIGRMAQALADQVSTEVGGVSLGSVAEAQMLVRDLLQHAAAK